jgi:hypothetical protein
MKKLICLSLLLVSALSFKTQDLKANTAYVCCLSNSMKRCAVVMYPGPGGEGPMYNFDGLKVACPQIP